MRKWIVRSLLALLLLAVAAGIAWSILGPVTVEVASPTRGPAVEAVYGSGTVEPTVMLPIAPKLAGRLSAFMADEGDTVKKDQVLARLDDRELAATVAEWESRVRYGEVQFERADELFRRRTGTEAARDQARNELETARAALDRARRQLAEMTLLAPADGLIIRRDGELGQLIQAGETVFWMSCCAPLRITAEIDEEDIPLVRPGQKVLIRADAFPDRTLEGTVAEITPKGDPVARSFRVRVSLPAQTPLMIGMTTDCNIVIQERADALLVPSEAVSEGKVWLVQDGRLARRAVETGVTGEGRTEIRGGIGPDDLVVVAPQAGLREGASVRTRPARGP